MPGFGSGVRDALLCTRGCGRKDKRTHKWGSTCSGHTNLVPTRYSAGELSSGKTEEVLRFWPNYDCIPSSSLARLSWVNGASVGQTERGLSLLLLGHFLGLSMKGGHGVVGDHA